MESEIKHFLKNHFDLAGNLEPMPGYEDINFKLVGKGGEFVVKLSGIEQVENIAMQSRIMEVLQDSAERHLYPGIILSNSGNPYEKVTLNDAEMILRVIPWLNGELFATAERSEELYSHLGSVLGKMDRALKESQIWLKRKDPYVWDLQYAHHSKKNIGHIKDSAVRRLVHYFLHQFEMNYLPQIDSLEASMIHSDANDYNMLVSGQNISGVFDFGDAVYTCKINELGIALAYVLMDEKDLIERSATVVEAYHKQLTLSQDEIEVLYYLIAARLCVTICQASYSRYKNPGNTYLFVSEASAIPSSLILHV